MSETPKPTLPILKPGDQITDDLMNDWPEVPIRAKGGFTDPERGKKGEIVRKLGQLTQRCPSKPYDL